MGGVSPLLGLEPVLFRQRVHRLTVYTLFEGTSTGEEANATGDLDIASDLTINGAGASTTIINANQIDRVLHIRSGTIEISSVTITNGNSGIADGGGILNLGTLTLTSSTVSGNTAANWAGGIRNEGSLVLSGSVYRQHIWDS